MAFEELLQLLSKEESLSRKQGELMRLTMRAMEESLLSGEMTVRDPEVRAVVARYEALALRACDKAASSVEMATRMAAKYAPTPGGELAVEALRRMVARATTVDARALEFAAVMRGVSALEEDEEEEEEERPGGPAVRKSKRFRRPNTRYFSPKWSN